MTPGCTCCNSKMPYAEEASEKKKKKFWDIFRRRRKGSDSSSDDEDDIRKRGFLGRKKRDRGSKDVTNSFFINPVKRVEKNDIKNSVESIRSTSSDLSGRRRVKAKVEASRELLAQNSSSDEASSYTSYTSSLQSGGSFPKRSRAARTERHNRRMSRDFEGRVNKWSASVVYQESKDYDTKYRAKARSATPSPAQSPKVKRVSPMTKRSFKSTSFDSINGKRAPPTPPPRRDPRPQSMADPPRYYPPVYTAPSHLIHARLRQSSQRSVSEQYLNGQRARLESSRSASPRPTESPSSVSSESNKKDDFRPLSVVVEKSEASDPDARRPPPPPRRGSISSDVTETRKHSAYLEDALNELEAIYKKLSCDDQSVDWSMSNGEVNPTDDMAYRRLNRRESSVQDVREILGQAGSYLLVSPTLSPPAIVSHVAPLGEPDVTLDDVVFRSVQHSNNSLRVQDPQPPFGIPLGPISPAANSDYLHATPPIIPGSSPDLVLDDLAFRNLRKDHNKKKAVRSLSANLSGIINRNYFNNNNVNVVNNNLEEKSQSYSDIPEEMRLAQRVLDMRRKKKSPEKDKPEKFSFSEQDTESALLEQLAAETKAASDQIDKELRQLSGVHYTRSMTDLLQEMTKNLDCDFGCQACSRNNSQSEVNIQPLRFKERILTKPGSIGPPRPKNPFKEEPWGKVKREPTEAINGDMAETYRKEVRKRREEKEEPCDKERRWREEKEADEACRDIRDTASSLRRLERRQDSGPGQGVA